MFTHTVLSLMFSHLTLLTHTLTPECCPLSSHSECSYTVLSLMISLTLLTPECSLTPHSHSHSSHNMFAHTCSHSHSVIPDDLTQSVLTQSVLTLLSHTTLSHYSHTLLSHTLISNHTLTPHSHSNHIISHKTTHSTPHDHNDHNDHIMPDHHLITSS